METFCVKGLLCVLRALRAIENQFRGKPRIAQGEERELGRLLGEETQKKFRCFKSKPELLIFARDLCSSKYALSQLMATPSLGVDQTKNFDDILALSFLSIPHPIRQQTPSDLSLS